MLESLAIAYELTGDVKYLKPGIKTFDKTIDSKAATTNGVKKIVDDAVICAGATQRDLLRVLSLLLHITRHVRKWIVLIRHACKDQKTVVILKYDYMVMHYMCRNGG